jgi:hypothetical protein
MRGVIMTIMGSAPYLTPITYRYKVDNDSEHHTIWRLQYFISIGHIEYWLTISLSSNGNSGQLSWILRENCLL